MNVPYVKRYDENGTLLNPIIGKYVNKFQNRQQRKSSKFRFHNNSKSTPLLITGKFKYFKRLQKIFFFDKKEDKFEFRVIEHYDLKLNY